MVRYLIPILFIVVLPGLSFAADDWRSRRGFTLCLREEGKTNNYGYAFLIRTFANESICIRGTYLLLQNTSPPTLTLTFTEAWHGSTLGSNAWWKFDSAYSHLESPAVMKFEWLRQGNKLVLTHIPESDDLDLPTLLGPSLPKMTWGEGDIVEFERTVRSEFTDDKMPPSLTSVADYKNRHRDNPHSTWGLGFLTTRELMVITSDSDHKVNGYGALKLTPSKDDPWSGTAWLFHHDLTATSNTLCGRGTFSIASDTSDVQARVMQLRFPRVFEYVRGTGVSAWRTKSNTETGLSMKLLVADGGFDEVIRGYVNELFFINKRGERERRFFKHGLLNLQRSEYSAYECLEFNALDSVQLQPLRSLKEFSSVAATKFQQVLVDAPPPGFKQSTLKSEELGFVRAKNRANAGDKAGARRQYRLALGNYPDNADRLRDYYQLLDDDDDVARKWSLKHLARLDPQSADVHLAYAFYQKKSGQIEDAIRSVDRAIAAPSNKRIAYTRNIKSDYLYELGRFKESYHEALPYVRANYTDLLLFNKLAWNYAEHADASWDSSLPKFFTTYLTAERAKNNYCIYLDTAAAVHAKLGQFSDAVEKQKNVVALSPKDEKEEAELRLAIFEAKKDLTQGVGYKWWKDTSGVFKVAAKIVSYDGSNVRMLKLNGRTITAKANQFNAESRAQLPTPRTTLARPVASN